MILTEYERMIQTLRRAEAENLADVLEADETCQAARAMLPTTAARWHDTPGDQARRRAALLHDVWHRDGGAS